MQSLRIRNSSFYSDFASSTFWMTVSVHTWRSVQSSSRERVDADELEWYIPAAILVEELQRTLNVINQFLHTPIDLEGKKASQLFSKKRRRRRRRSPSPESDADGTSGEVMRKNRKEKKKKEKETYKSDRKSVV